MRGANGAETPLVDSPRDADSPEAFLRVATPEAWLSAAVENWDVLLLDHANCEKKAAGTALSLMYRYVDRPGLLSSLSRLAREELRHFEQVQRLIVRLGIPLKHVSASRYAGALRGEVRANEPERLLDTLLVSALVEARSCERFGRLAGILPDDIAALYRDLRASEARHFAVYLSFAHELADGSAVGERLAHLLDLEADLIERPDHHFRFHGGPPV